MLFRWSDGLGVDGEVWHASTFSKNRERFLESDIAAEFFAAMLGQARAQGLLSAELFTVDGTLIEAWVSLKSFRPTTAAGASEQSQARQAGATRK